MTERIFRKDVVIDEDGCDGEGGWWDADWSEKVWMKMHPEEENDSGTTP